jgi:hypothetical protein
MKKVYLLPTTLLLACCASPSKIDVAEAGQLPKPAAYNVSITASAPVAATERVRSALTSRGFKVADPADYLVQIASSDTPGKTGLFLPESTSDTEQRAWLMPPSRSNSRHAQRIVITLTHLATGKEVYRASGTEYYSASKADKADALADAVVAQLTRQNSITPVR